MKAGLKDDIQVMVFLVDQKELYIVGQKGALNCLIGGQNSLEPLYTELSFTPVAGLQAIAQPSEFSVGAVQLNTRDGIRTESASFRLVCLKHIGHIFTAQIHLRHEIDNWIVKSRVLPIKDPCYPGFIGRVEQDVFMPQVTVRKPMVRTTLFQVSAVPFPPVFCFALLAWCKGCFQEGVCV